MGPDQKTAPGRPQQIPEAQRQHIRAQHLAAGGIEHADPPHRLAQPRSTQRIGRILFPTVHVRLVTAAHPGLPVDVMLVDQNPAGALQNFIVLGRLLQLLSPGQRRSRLAHAFPVAGGNREDRVHESQIRLIAAEPGIKTGLPQFPRLITWDHELRIPEKTFVTEAGIDRKGEIRPPCLQMLSQFPVKLRNLETAPVEPLLAGVLQQPPGVKFPSPGIGPVHRHPDSGVTLKGGEKCILELEGEGAALYRLEAESLAGGKFRFLKEGSLYALDEEAAGDKEAVLELPLSTFGLFKVRYLNALLIEGEGLFRAELRAEPCAGAPMPAPRFVSGRAGEEVRLNPPMRGSALALKVRFFSAGAKLSAVTLTLREGKA